MRRSYLFLLLLVAVTSCNSQDSKRQKEEPPIPISKMEDIVIDLHLAEVYSSITRDSNHMVTIKNIDSLALYHRDVIAHHNLSLDQLNDITEWFKYHPEQLDTVYNRIIPRITEMEARLAK